MLKQPMLHLIGESCSMLIRILKNKGYRKRDIRDLFIKWIKLAVTLMFISFIYFSELVYVLCLAFFFMWLVVLIIITSFFWVPLIIMWGPFIMFMLGIILYTRFGEVLVECPLRLIDFATSWNVCRAK